MQGVDTHPRKNKNRIFLQVLTAAYSFGKTGIAGFASRFRSMKTTLILCFLGIVSVPSSAQIFEKQFGRRYGGSKAEIDGINAEWGFPRIINNECTVQCTVGPDTSFFFTTSTQSADYYVHGNHGESEVWIVKTRPNGDTVFTRTFGSTSRDFSFGIAALADGGCVVTGCHSESNFDFAGTGVFATGRSAFLIRVDSLGQLVYKRAYGGSNDDRLLGLTPTADGGYLLCGYSASYDGLLATALDTAGYAWVVKTDSMGVVEWNTQVAWKDTLPATRRETFFKALELPGGKGYILGGAVTLDYQTAYNNDFFLVRMDTAGQVVWKQKLGGAKGDFVTGLCLMANQEVVVTGPSGNGSTDDFRMIGIDTTGSVIWEKVLSGSFLFRLFDVKPFTKNRIIAVGYLVNLGSPTVPSTASADGWLALLDSAGNLQAQMVGGGAKADFFESCALLPNQHEVLLAGITRSDPNPWVTGSRFGTVANDIDAWLVRLKITDTMAVGTVPLVEQKQPRVYPQPCFGAFSVWAPVPVQQAVLYDSRGRVVRAYSPATLDQNLYTTAGLPPGVYSLCLRTAAPAPTWCRVVVE